MDTEITQAVPAAPAEPDMLLGSCIQCGRGYGLMDLFKAEFTKDACPGCGCSAKPLEVGDYVYPRVHWSELRTLGAYAEAYARLQPGEDGERMRAIVQAIASRLEAQHPGRPPITMTSSLAQLQRLYPELQVPDGERPPSWSLPGGEWGTLHALGSLGRFHGAQAQAEQLALDFWKKLHGQRLIAFHLTTHPHDPSVEAVRLDPGIAVQMMTPGEVARVWWEPLMQSFARVEGADTHAREALLAIFGNVPLWLEGPSWDLGADGQTPTPWPEATGNGQKPAWQLASETPLLQED